MFANRPIYPSAVQQKTIISTTLWEGWNQTKDRNLLNLTTCSNYICLPKHPYHCVTTAHTTLLFGSFWKSTTILYQNFWSISQTHDVPLPILLGIPQHTHSDTLSIWQWDIIDIATITLTLSVPTQSFPLPKCQYSSSPKLQNPQILPDIIPSTQIHKFWKRGITRHYAQIVSFIYLLYCNNKSNSIPYHTKTLLTSDQPLHSWRTDQFWLGLYSPNKLRPSRSSEYSDTTPFITDSWNQLLFLSFVLDVNVSCPQDRSEPSWLQSTKLHLEQVLPPKSNFPSHDSQIMFFRASFYRACTLIPQFCNFSSTLIAVHELPMLCSSLILLRTFSIGEGPVLRSFSYIKQSWDFFTFEK